MAAVVALLSAALWALAFPPWDLGGLAWLAFLPGLFWWRGGGVSLKRFLLSMGLVHAAAWTLLLSWLRHTFAIGFEGWPVWASQGLGVLAAAALGGILSLFAVAWWWAAARALGDNRASAGLLERPWALRLLAWLGLAGLWAVLEWSRGWVLGGFPWCPLAASQWQMPPLLQVLAYTGETGLSALIVLGNLAIFSYLHRLLRHRRGGWARLCPEFYVTLGLVLALGLGIYREGLPRRPLPAWRVGVVQPDIPQDTKWVPEEAGRILDILRSATDPLGSLSADLLLWPEAVTPYPIRSYPVLQDWVRERARAASAPLVLGSIVLEADGPARGEYNGAFVVDPSAGFDPAFYAKRRLVPFGEFVPLRSWFPWLAKFVPIGGDFGRGTSAAPLVVHAAGGRELKLGLLLCYEDVFSGLARDNAAAGAQLQVVLTNNNWFGRGGAAYQHAVHSVLRAVETRRPVVRCGNAGWSGWIDEYGHVRAVMTGADGRVYFRGSEVLEVRVDARWEGRRSFFVEHGDWFPATGLAVALVAGGALVLVRRRQRSAGPA